MHHSEIRTFEQLVDYLRHFRNFGARADVGEFDFVGTYLLFDALLSNLAENSVVEDDFIDLAKSFSLTPQNAELLKGILAHLRTKNTSE